MLSRTAFSRTRNIVKAFTIQLNSSRSKVTIDKSKVPVLHENDLEEKFIKGSGPGGQKVNKSNNCVYLLHKPTGVSVKVHQFREQAENRKKARERLVTMLDNLINKENSVENQKKRISREKLIKRAQRQKKITEMKENLKKVLSESENNEVF